MVRQEVTQLTMIARDCSGPFEVMTLAFIFVGRLASLLSDGPPGSIEIALGSVSTLIWSVFILSGSATALAGIFWRGHPQTARLIEQAGLIPVAGASIVYAVVLLLGQRHADFTTTAFVAGYGIAAMWRALQIHLILHEPARETVRA